MSGQCHRPPKQEIGIRFVPMPHQAGEQTRSEYVNWPVLHIALVDL